MKSLHFMTIFLCVLFALVIPAPGQKSPDEYFGVQIGADRTLVKYTQMMKYFYYLADHSQRIEIREEGYSTLRNPMILAVISSENNLARLPELIEINRRLANPDQLPGKEAQALIKQSRLFLMITASIHATEIGASQMSLPFAHELVVSEDEKLKQMLENVVILLMPCANPDGNILVVDWYRKHLNTANEGAAMPYLYHHYAGHDNNRDFFMLNLAETRVINSILYRKYVAHILLDMHQMGSSGPRMFVPPFMDPINPDVHPLLLRTIGLAGYFMAYKLQQNGLTGVANSYSFDAYWPGGCRSTPWYKNVPALLTEVASAKLATPITVDANELRASGKGIAEYKPQTNFPDPWQGGDWRLSDIIAYEKVAVVAMLEICARLREDFVSNFYRLNRENIVRGKSEKPYGYLVPAEQWDIPETYVFLNRLQEHGVRLQQLAERTIIEKRIFEKGAFFIPMDQPYRNFIKTMLEIQEYPQIRTHPGGPIMMPYDSTAWTLPLMMNVKCAAVDTHLEPEKLIPINLSEVIPAARITGSGSYYRISGRYNQSFTVVNQLLKRGIDVYRVSESGRNRHGDFLVPVAKLRQTDLLDLLGNRGFSIELTEPESDRLIKLTKKNPALFYPFQASMDEGWTRWVLDQYDFLYSRIDKNEFQDKQRLKQYSSIVFPDINRALIVEGASRRPSTLPEKYQGGIGKKGIQNLVDYVREGGHLILMDSSYELAVTDFKLPLRNHLEGVDRSRFTCPGSILRLHLDNRDPLAWGLAEKTIIYFSNSPAFNTSIPDTTMVTRKVIGRFSEKAPHLMSGYILGQEYLDRSVMIVRFKYHQGHVIVLGGRIQYRGQTYATFKLLFNAILFQEPADPRHEEKPS